MNAELFWRFALVSALAFGGGAGLPLAERTAVREAHWVSDRDFAAAVAFGQMTPGPVLVLATFIGYRVAGAGGALSATLGVFAIPWALATGAARQFHAAARAPRLRGFVRAQGRRPWGCSASRRWDWRATSGRAGRTSSSPSRPWPSQLLTRSTRR